MDTYTQRHIDELPTIAHGLLRLAGDELGIRSFGLQVLDLPPAFADYPAHDHAEDGQEEVYVVLSGTVDFEVAGERVAAQPGTMIRVAPGARRNLVPGADGARVLAVGRTTDGAYERPDDFRVGTRA